MLNSKCHVSAIPPSDSQHYAKHSRRIFLKDTNKPFNAGEVVLIEREPLLSVHKPEGKSDLVLLFPELEKMMTKKGSSWDEYNQLIYHEEDVFEMRNAIKFKANCPEHYKDDLCKGAAIYRANALSVPCDSEGFLGTNIYVLPFYSRFNHSCSPSVALERPRHATDKSLAFEWRYLAGQRSVASDQLFVSYLGDSGLEPAAKRQEELATFFFKCHCKACTHPAISDPRRALLRELSNIDKSEDQNQHIAYLSKIKQAIEAAREEELFYFIPKICYFGATAHAFACLSSYKKHDYQEAHKHYNEITTWWRKLSKRLRNAMGPLRQATYKMNTMKWCIFAPRSLRFFTNMLCTTHDNNIVLQLFSTCHLQFYYALYTMHHHFM